MVMGMTEKRFTFDIDDENGIDEPYFCNGMDSFYVDNADEMELFIEELNELVEENEGFKKLLTKIKKNRCMDYDVWVELQGVDLK